MYRWWSLCTAGEIITGCAFGGVYVLLVKLLQDVPLVEFMYRWWSLVEDVPLRVFVYRWRVTGRCTSGGSLCTAGGIMRGYTSGAGNVPCIYSHAR